MNSPAFPWNASPVFHFRFYQHTSTLLWSGDTVCRRMNRPPYSGEQSVRGEGYQGTLRDEIGTRSSFYLFNEWKKKTIYLSSSLFMKEALCSIKMSLSINIKEVLASRKYVRYPEAVEKLWIFYTDNWVHDVHYRDTSSTLTSLLIAVCCQ